MIRTLSENVVVPIAGMIISFVLIYELITMVIDKNNMHDFDTSLFFRFLFKACIAVMLLSKTFDIVMAVFDVGSHMVTQAAASISGSTSLIGTNYLKGLVALAFQGFFIMVCVAIYAVLVASVAVAGNLHSALWSVAAYTVILCFSLFKTGSISKAILNTH